MHRYLGVVAAANIIMVTQAEARKASCIVMDPNNPTKVMVSLDVDDVNHPYITNVKAIDSEVSDVELADIKLFDPSSSVAFRMHYSNVKVDINNEYSKVYFEISPTIRESMEEPVRMLSNITGRHTIYINWKRGEAGWMDELFMYNYSNVLKEKPWLAVRPASCERLD